MSGEILKMCFTVSSRVKFSAFASIIETWASESLSRTAARYPSPKGIVAPSTFCQIERSRWVQGGLTRHTVSYMCIVVVDSLRRYRAVFFDASILVDQPLYFFAVQLFPYPPPVKMVWIL